MLRLIGVILIGAASAACSSASYDEIMSARTDEARRLQQEAFRWSAENFQDVTDASVPECSGERVLALERSSPASRSPEQETMLQKCRQKRALATERLSNHANELQNRMRPAMLKYAEAYAMFAVAAEHCGTGFNVESMRALVRRLGSSAGIAEEDMLDHYQNAVGQAWLDVVRKPVDCAAVAQKVPAVKKAMAEHEGTLDNKRLEPTR